MKVLVTGGTGGIGFNIVDLFKSNGHIVDAPTRAELDLTKDITLIDTDYDVVINNAGINPVLPITEVTDIDVMTVNYLAPLRIIQNCLPYMKERKYGRILNIGSIWVEQTKKHRSAYSASKAALDALSRSITAEYAQYNVLANTLSPGFIGTQLTYKNNTPEDLKQIVSNVPVGRLGTPAEIAALAYFLTVDNTYISGQNIIIDGGFSCTR
jgi:3-oxoacyl-[acyl-carrier protein] reductase